jgi:hypothetical protein
MEVPMAKTKNQDKVREPPMQGDPLQGGMIFESIHQTEAPDKPKGWAWDVTIIGAQDPGAVVESDGRRYIVSKNGRLYDTKLLADSVSQWEGVKVYDNHLSPKEYQEKGPMRSPLKEWLGTIVDPIWDEENARLRGQFKVVDEGLASKLLNAWDQGVLNTVGLSIDVVPGKVGAVTIEGKRIPVIEGFKSIQSVDLVGDPAAGGRFDRILASVGSDDLSLDKESTMDEDTIKALIEEAVGEIDVPNQVRRVIEEALEASEEEEEEFVMPEEEEEEEEEEEAQESQAMAAVRKLESDLMVKGLIERSNLPDEYQNVVEAAFPKGHVHDKRVVNRMVKRVREAYASSDTSGEVQGAGNSQVSVGMNEEDVASAEFLRLVAGNNQFKAIEHMKDDFVKDRVTEGYQAWIRDGRPNYGTRRLSQWVYEYLGGDPLVDPHAYEAITTSSMGSIVKNALNLILAADYSVKERWWDPIVREEEVDTIDEATLIRVYGMDTLDIVAEGDPYTELGWEDEEETATFVKKGNYAGITLETLLRDKLNTVRSIPDRLSNSWYNTLSDLVAGVFTVNTLAGPVLSDTGALFNATAVTSAGGHANLLTTALSASEFGVCRLAMRKQTDQTLGTGRRLHMTPKYLLIPADLEATAEVIRNSQLEPGADFDSAGGGAQAINPYYQKFEIVPVPNWTDTKDWALVADPVQFPAIWLIFLRGLKTPELFTADSDVAGAMFTNDTLRYKIRLMTFRFSATYDCAPVSDFRPLHKSNVA